MKVSTVLARAAKLVERGWCKHHPAMTEDGLWTQTTNPNATMFCMLGSIWRTLGQKWATTSKPIEEFLNQFLPSDFGCTSTFNDRHDTESWEVVTWLSSAAEWAKVLGK